MGKGNTNYGRTVGGSESAPWGPQQPYIQSGFDAAKTQLNSGSTVAPLSPQTQTGLGMVEGAAQSSQLPQQAAGQLSNTMGGDYLQPWQTTPNMSYLNPYMDALQKSISHDVTPAIQGDYMLSGRSGSSPGAKSNIMEGVADAMAPYVFGSAENQMGRQFDSYQSERDRQMQAANMAPSTQAGLYGPGQAMMGVGSIYDQYAQAQLDNPAQKLANYMNVVGNPFGSQTTTDMTAPTSQDKPLGVGNVMTK